MIPFPTSGNAAQPHIPSPGFADPVRDAQRCFRKLLAAISYPGRAQDLHGLLSSAPAPLYPTTAALCLTLLDVETVVWLDGPFDTPDVRQFLSFHCGCKIATHPGEAAFALLDGKTAAPRLQTLHLGTPEYPDRATTALIQVPATAGGAKTLGRGPGIAEHQEFDIAGLQPEFWARRTTVNAAFPTGLDIVFVDPRLIVGLPRAIQMEGATPCTLR
jgi:alpha-D-ribose 1-methylphosphonate 5-triphosphate synthase subunit PhnH